jgi:DNA-binding transcriptional ArsR family regulator
VAQGAGGGGGVRPAIREAVAAADPHWNGNQEFVYQTLARIGSGAIGDIAQAAGLENATVSNHLRRLRDKGRVRCIRGTFPMQWEVVRSECLLDQVWR